MFGLSATLAFGWGVNHLLIRENKARIVLVENSVIAQHVVQQSIVERLIKIETDLQWIRGKMEDSR